MDKLSDGRGLGRDKAGVGEEGVDERGGGDVEGGVLGVSAGGGDSDMLDGAIGRQA